MPHKFFAPILAFGVTAALASAGAVVAWQTPAVQAQAAREAIDEALNARIRAEGMERSQIMRTEHFLTDVYGPRVTGSPNHEHAARWAVTAMESWGMKNGRLEPWDFAREGWTNERADGHIVAPVKANLVFAVLAWTPSTNGTVTAPAVNLVTPVGPPAPAAAGGRGAATPTYLGPTQAELDAYFAQMAANVKGAIVLVGASRIPPFLETEAAKRRNDEQTERQYNPDPNAPAGRGGRGGAGGGRGAPPTQTGQPVRLTTAQVNQQVLAFLLSKGAAMRVSDAGERLGIIRAQSGNGYDPSKQLPGVLLRNDDYGRIARLLADGTPVTLEFNIVNHTYPEGRTSYNAVAEIPGTDKADEVVMMGGHLDSWQAATGATDNAIGCAIMMEAARILQAVGAKPRRTIRVALWSGEEEGLLGSLAYVAQHFGTFENPKPEFARLDAYWNIDTGTGLIRGGSIFGPPEGARILAQFMKPWEDFKVYGATASTSRATGGTDSTSFNHAGLPGIGSSQDPIEYNSYTHHTNLDTYERILPNDVIKDAVITASIVYHIANREAMMPRFTKEQMPALPPATPAASTSAPAAR